MQALLTGVLKKLIEWVAALAKKWWDRRQEQKSRHAENEAKGDAYKEATNAEAKDDFEKLP